MGKCVIGQLVAVSEDAVPDRLVGRQPVADGKDRYRGPESFSLVQQGVGEAEITGPVEREGDRRAGP